MESYARPMMRRLVWLQTALFGAFLFVAWAYRGVPPTSPVYAGALGLAALPLAIPAHRRDLTGHPGLRLFLLLLLDAVLVAVAHSLRRLASPMGLLFLASTVVWRSTCAPAPISCARRRSATSLWRRPLLRHGERGLPGVSPGRCSSQSPFSGRGTAQSPSKPGATRRPGSLRMPILVVSALSLAAAVLVGHPQLGANFGGGRRRGSSVRRSSPCESG